jgi:hypothetical protein
MDRHLAEGSLEPRRLKRLLASRPCAARLGFAGLAGLNLLDSKVSKTGVTINTYERAAAIRLGSFEFDEQTQAELERRERLAAS